MGTQFDTAGRIADRQHGRVAREQLLAAGVDRSRITRWLRDGRLRPVHRGVYAVGHLAPSRLGDYMAAVLACGARTILSHRAAAHVLRLRAGTPPPPEVTVPVAAGRRRPGIRVHRSPVPAPDAATLNGIPIATVPRVLLDLAAVCGLEELTRMCHEAWVHHGTTPAAIEACIARNPAKPGARRLRLALGTGVTLSELESLFVALLRDHGLPAARTNVDRAGDKVDCHWPAAGLTVELQSYRFHASRHAFERDLARRRRSDHIAYSWGDVAQRPLQTAADLRARLARSPG